MYRYDEFDHALVRARAAEFRGQVTAYLAGEMSAEEFRPLRLRSGVFEQRNAPMLRVAIPYGTLSGRQMARLADIAETWDRGYGHFTTRQNIQFNWPRLEDVPDILDALAEVEMHAIQTAGAYIRNTTSDPLAGVAADEIEDPRPTAELIRQWSMLHPEFPFLGRKFKVAVTGAEHDRTAAAVHDLGVRIVRNAAGEVGYRIIAGGGLGRTPMIGQVLREFLPKADLLAYLDAALRVFDRHGRRDNKHKTRIKILVHELGAGAFRALVEEEFARGEATAIPDRAELARIAAYFAPPNYDDLPAESAALERAMRAAPELAAWVEQNAQPHRVPGYVAATVSLKPAGGAPGNATAAQMRALAAAAEAWSLDELRVTHEQNIVLPHVRKDDLPALWRALRAAGLDTPNRGLLTDMIACPGMEYCNLAVARSIPAAQAIAERFADPARQREIGPLSIRISGCVNSCAHNHVGDIGVVGIEKAGRESYQITLGGDPSDDPALGEHLGPGFGFDELPEVIEKLTARYLALRAAGEPFRQTYRRVGMAPFRAAVYGEG